jgi:head-tail adaptor
MSFLHALHRPLVLEEVTRQPDNAGGYTETWVVLGTLFADVKPGAGRERALNSATLSYVPYRIVVRASPVGAVSRPKAGQRFRDGDRVFRIEAVADRYRDGLFLECFTKEEVLA